MALKGKRDKAIVATKFGFNIIDGKTDGVNSHPKHIRNVVESSLLRLGMDHIDLLYQHRVDPAVPIEEVIGVMSKLVKEGKVRYLGLSEAGEKTIRRAHKVHPISALQSEYSLWERSLEERIIPVLKELEIGLVPFCPLGRGFLTGTVQRAEEYSEKDYRKNDPRFQGKHFDANMQIVTLLNKMGKAKRVTPAQMALAWLLHKGNSFVPIPGTKRKTYLEENTQAAGVTLTQEEMGMLDLSLPAGVTSGERYPDYHLALIDQ